MTGVTAYCFTESSIYMCAGGLPHQHCSTVQQKAPIRYAAGSGDFRLLGKMLLSRVPSLAYLNFNPASLQTVLLEDTVTECRVRQVAKLA